MWKGEGGHTVVKDLTGLIDFNYDSVIMSYIIVQKNNIVYLPSERILGCLFK